MEQLTTALSLKRSTHLSPFSSSRLFYRQEDNNDTYYLEKMVLELSHNKRRIRIKGGKRTDSSKPGRKEMKFNNLLRIQHPTGRRQPQETINSAEQRFHEGPTYQNLSLKA